MFDVIVVGGGHAGVEARPRRRGGARASRWSRSMPTNIGAMSCNPAIGGLGKGHLVREVDAFDGVIARAADAAGDPLSHAQPQQGRRGAGARASRPTARATPPRSRRDRAAQPASTVVEGEAAR